MQQSNAQRSELDDGAPPAGNRPVAKYKQGGIDLAVWANPGENGTMYSATITNSYKDEKTGDWKPTTSYSPTDLLVVANLANQAFAEIGKLKQQGRAR